MSQYNWYSLEKHIHTILNANRVSSMLYSYEQNVYFRHFLNHYQHKPEDFTPNMVIDMSTALISKLNKILTLESDKDEAKKTLLIEQIFQLSQIDRDSSQSSMPLHKIKGYSFCTRFATDVNLFSSKGKKGYGSEIKQLQEDLALFKNQNWYKNLTPDILMGNFDPKKGPKLISFKNLLLSLDKLFPHFKTDNNYIELKEQYFQSYFINLKNHQKDPWFFSQNPFSEILSFLKDFYHEETMEYLISVSKGVPDYSYLKHKSAIDKIITLYPQSKVILSAYMNEINDNNLESIFLEEDFKLLSISLDLRAIEKTLLLNSVKANAIKIKESILINITKEKKLNNPFSWFTTADIITLSPKDYKISLFFKVPLKEYLELGEEFIKKFMKKQLSDLIFEPTKSTSLSYYDILWNEALMHKSIESLPKNTIKSVVKKF